MEALRLGRPLFLLESLVKRADLKWPGEMMGYGVVFLALGQSDASLRAQRQAGMTRIVAPSLRTSSCSSWVRTSSSRQFLRRAAWVSAVSSPRSMG